jgi:uncharacterized protein YigE (DUF2233 family)
MLKTVLLPSLVCSLAFAHIPNAIALDSRLLHAAEGDYRVVTLDLAHDNLGLYWRDAEDQAYASIEALRRIGDAQGRPLAFATNAGIYDREFRPLGLTIADGKTLRPINTTQGSGRSGNFGMQPNGIFYVDSGGRAGVVATRTWRERRIDARNPTQ